MARSARKARRARGFVVSQLGTGLVPLNVSLPAISGTAQAGQVLTASAGTWTNAPTSFDYQWLRDGVPISGSINASRTVVTADVGHVLSCTVTATRLAVSTSITSAATAIVIAAPTPIPVNSAAPVISGTATVGQTLASTTGTWTNSPTSYAYAWRRDGVDIAGAAASSYVVASADQGHAITCRVYATNTGGTAGATSNAISVAAATASASAARRAKLQLERFPIRRRHSRWRQSSWRTLRA